MILRLLFVLIPFLISPSSLALTLSDPEVFDLRIDPDLFRGKFPWDPQIQRCHTQGLQVTRSEILISCCLYDSRKKSERIKKNEGFLLKAPSREILSPSSSPKVPWTIRKITDHLPETPYPLGHPSGLAWDDQRGGIWLANSVYGTDSFARIHFLKPPYSHPSRSITLPDHIGAVVPVKNFLIGLTWGSNGFQVLNLESGRSRLIPNRLRESVDYQGCQELGSDEILCSGNLPERVKKGRRLRGRIHRIAVEGNDLENVVFHLKEVIEKNLGIREVSYEEGIGDLEQAVNSYGGYETALTLTNEGMSLGPDRKFVYFLPEDIPGGRLIRYRISVPSVP